MGLVKVLSYFIKHCRCKCKSSCSLNEDEGVIDRQIVQETSL